MRCGFYRARRPPTTVAGGTLAPTNGRHGGGACPLAGRRWPGAPERLLRYLGSFAAVGSFSGDGATPRRKLDRRRRGAPTLLHAGAVAKLPLVRVPFVGLRSEHAEGLPEDKRQSGTAGNDARVRSAGPDCAARR